MTFEDEIIEIIDGKLILYNINRIIRSVNENCLDKQRVKRIIDHELERLRKQCGILQYDALVNVKNKLGLK